MNDLNRKLLVYFPLNMTAATGSATFLQSTFHEFNTWQELINNYDHNYDGIYIILHFLITLC